MQWRWTGRHSSANDSRPGYIAIGFVAIACSTAHALRRSTYKQRCHVRGPARLGRKLIAARSVSQSAATATSAGWGCLTYAERLREDSGRGSNGHTVVIMV